MIRPKELRADSIEQTCRVVSGHLAWVEAFAVQIAHRANSDCGEGISARRYDTVNRGGNDLTGPERHAESMLAGRRDDPVDGYIVTFERDLREIAKLANALRTLGGKITTSEDELDKRETSMLANAANRGVGAGYCSICNRYCPGIRNDRIVSRRCPTCLRYWERHRREEDRPKELWGEEDVA